MLWKGCRGRRNRREDVIPSLFFGNFFGSNFFQYFWKFLNSSFFQSAIIAVSAAAGFYIWKRQKYFDIANDILIYAKNYEQSIYQLRIYFTRIREPLKNKENIQQNEYQREYLNFYTNEAFKNIENCSDAFVSALNQAEIILMIECTNLKNEIHNLNLEIHCAILKIAKYNFDTKNENINEDFKKIFHSYDTVSERIIEKQAGKIVNDTTIMIKKFL